MIDLQMTLTVLQGLVAALQEHWPAEFRPHPGITAGVILCAGTVLAVRGARLLKTAYVLSFMVVGGLAGVEIVRDIGGIDDLIGLVVGAGVAGPIGGVLYRWWISVSTGTIALLLVGLLWGPPIVAQAWQDFQDHKTGRAQAAYLLPPAPVQQLSPRDLFVQNARDLLAFVWEQQRDRAVRALFMFGAAYLFGWVLGLLFPRFSAVMGTSLLGVGAVAAGIALLLANYRPALWTSVTEHLGWFWGMMAGLLLISLSLQTRRPAAPAPPPPVPAEQPA